MVETFPVNTPEIIEIPEVNESVIDADALVPETPVGTIDIQDPTS